MKATYDGLKIVHIPMNSANIFTTSGCVQSVKNIMPVNVCVSEHEGDYDCSDYSTGRYTEWETPNGGPSEDEIFC